MSFDWQIAYELGRMYFNDKRFAEAWERFKIAKDALNVVTADLKLFTRLQLH